MLASSPETVSSEELSRLQSSELLLEVIADNVAELIAVVDSSGRRIWNNEAYAKRLGYLPEELKGSDSLVEIHPDDVALVRQTFEESMIKGRGRRIEYRMRRKDGGWVALESEGRVAHHWNGHERCLVVVARDVTARKQEEQEKQERSQLQMERAQALAEFAGSKDLQDGELAICFANVSKTALKLTGFQRVSIWTMEEEDAILGCRERMDTNHLSSPGQILTKLEHPAFFELLKADRVIAARSLFDDERLIEIAPAFTEVGVTALLIVPFRRGTAVLGALIGERTDNEHGWNLDEVHFATSLADGLVLAIDARERLNAYQRLHVSQQQLARELREAAAYVQSLLPAPAKGSVSSDWRFIPSAALGGDAFGYHWLDEEHLAIYLLDVVGHGVRAALLSVAAMNQLRNGLPGTDALDPARVLTSINEAFQMDEQDDMYFTLWYGIYDKTRRRIDYGSAGHPPALLFGGHLMEPQQLHTRGLMIGAMPGAVYETASCVVGPGDRLFVFSDGVYEIERASGATATLQDLIRTLSTCADDGLDQIVAAARAMQRPGQSAFADDFSVVKLTFH